MPITRCLGKPLASIAAWHMASSGFDTMMSTALGECFAAFAAHSRTILELVLRRSSRLMPGLRGIPAVMITTSEFALAA
jgi:hypothetical protein